MEVKFKYKKMKMYWVKLQKLFLNAYFLSQTEGLLLLKLITNYKIYLFNEIKI